MRAEAVRSIREAIQLQRELPGHRLLVVPALISTGLEPREFPGPAHAEQTRFLDHRIVRWRVDL